jgi:hypothetical protein
MNREGEEGGRMNRENQAASVPAGQLVVVRPEPPDRYTAQVVGLPEIRATAATREEALQQVRDTLSQWLASGQLMMVELSAGNPLLQWCGWARDDPLAAEYEQELARRRQEDLERTLREDDAECSGSSSTPTT